MQITDKTTMGEFHAHFSDLGQNYELNLRVQRGCVRGSLQHDGVMLVANRGLMRDVLHHLGACVDVMLQDQFEDYRRIQTVEMSATLHRFVCNRLEDLQVAVEKCRHSTDITGLVGLDAYWVAVRRLLSFGLRIEASFNLKTQVGTIEVPSREW